MAIVRTNGIELHYEERGKGSPLILLMGLGAGGGLWADHVKAYEPYFRCIMVDNRGAGQSSKPEGPYTTAMMAKDTIGLLDALGIEQAHVSGISMGSAIAQEIALAAPKRVRSMTLNCAWSECDPYTTRIFETLRTGYSVMQAEDFQKLLQLIIYTPAYHAKHLDYLQASESAAAQDPARMPIHAFQAQCDACVAHRTAGRLGEIQVPTLITVGTRDLFTPIAMSEAIAREIPHAEFERFEGSGHTHHWDQLEAFNRRTLEFLLKQEGQ